MSMTKVRAISILAGMVVWVVWSGWAAAESAAVPPVSVETPRVIKDETGMCRQCHSRSVAVWQETAHKTTFDELHLRRKARTILENLGESGGIRRNELCVQCHYTQAVADKAGHVRAIAGISCQRCHGGGAAWVPVHHDTKAIPDRTERLGKSASLGMHATTGMYTLAAECFACHTVPRENLVNRGHHDTGSGFDFMDGMCESLRHNFLDDDPHQRREQDINHEVGAERRQLYALLGKTLALEFALRGLAEATEAGPYLSAMGERLQEAYAGLQGVDGVGGILAIVPTTGGQPKVEAGNRAAYLAAADAVQAIARTIEGNPERFRPVSGPALAGGSRK
jgi:cytochrome c5